MTEIYNPSDECKLQITELLENINKIYKKEFPYGELQRLIELNPHPQDLTEDVCTQLITIIFSILNYKSIDEEALELIGHSLPLLVISDTTASNMLTMLIWINTQNEDIIFDDLIFMLLSNECSYLINDSVFKTMIPLFQLEECNKSEFNYQLIEYILDQIKEFDIQLPKHHYIWDLINYLDATLPDDKLLHLHASICSKKVTDETAKTLLKEYPDIYDFCMQIMQENAENPERPYACYAQSIDSINILTTLCKVMTLEQITTCVEHANEIFEFMKFKPEFNEERMFIITMLAELQNHEDEIDKNAFDSIECNMPVFTDIIQIHDEYRGQVLLIDLLKALYIAFSCNFQDVFRFNEGEELNYLMSIIANTYAEFPETRTINLKLINLFIQRNVEYQIRFNHDIMAYNSKTCAFILLREEELYNIDLKGIEEDGKSIIYSLVEWFGNQFLPYDDFLEDGETTLWQTVYKENLESAN